MANQVLSVYVKKFIRENYLRMSGSDIAKRFGCCNSAVTRYIKSKGLLVPKEVRYALQASKAIGRTIMTPEQDQQLKDLYLSVPVKPLSELMGLSETVVRKRLIRLNLVIPRELINARIQAARIKPGNVPANKGRKQVEYMSQEQIDKTKASRFKKGNKNHNTLYDGCIRIRHDHPNRSGSKPHKHIRISKAVWKELQVYNWEQVNGPVPKGYLLACRNGDTLNCDPSNWEIITMAENARRNSGQLNLPDTYVAGLLARKSRKVDHNLKELIMEHPDLIDIKRKQILLNRAINGK